MKKMIEMRKAIQDILKQIHSRVYFHTAPSDAEMPYVVFDFPNSLDSGALENFVLEIDVWDDKTDTTDLETLIYEIDAEIHKKTLLIYSTIIPSVSLYPQNYDQATYSITFYRDNRLNLLDDDPRIRRRKYIYQARSYQKYNK